jgi:hypothetical protein
MILIKDENPFEEHVAYPEALRRLLTESWRIDGRRVVFG